MAFAVTDAVFDSRTIPESYILLRGMPKLPFNAVYNEPERTASLFRPDTPIAIVNNNCVIVAGQSLLNAFDRLKLQSTAPSPFCRPERLGMSYTSMTIGFASSNQHLIWISKRMEYLQLYQGRRGNSAATFRFSGLDISTSAFTVFWGIRHILGNDSICVFSSSCLQQY